MRSMTPDVSSWSSGSPYWWRPPVVTREVVWLSVLSWSRRTCLELWNKEASGRTDLGIPEETGVSARIVLPARKNLSARKRFPARKRLPALWQLLRWGLAFRRLLLLLTVQRESYVEGTTFSGGFNTSICMKPSSWSDDCVMISVGFT